MAEEVDEVEDVGTTVGPARSGGTNLARIIGRISLMRTPGGTSLVRTSSGKPWSPSIAAGKKER